MSRSSGRSAVAAAAYRMGVTLRDEAADRLHDYTRRSGVVRSYVLTPEDSPEWAHQPEALWNAVEARETRRNSVVARECELALPASVSARERDDIARAFAQELVDRYGVAVTVAIHEPPREGNGLNHHAHIMWTTRVMGPEGLGEKTRVLDDIKNTGPAEIHYLRQYAADLINDALERAGVDERVDPRSFKDRGIDLEPTEHLGPTATQIEREGKDSERGDRNREIDERNERLDELVEDLAQLDAQIAAEEELALNERYGVPEEERPTLGQADVRADASPEPDPAMEPDARRGKSWLFDRYGAPYERDIEQYGEIRQGDGFSWWERTVAVALEWRDTAMEWARAGWQRILDTWNGPDDPDYDPGRER